MLPSALAGGLFLHEYSYKLTHLQGTFPSPSAVALGLGNVSNTKRYM